LGESQGKKKTEEEREKRGDKIAKRGGGEGKGGTKKIAFHAWGGKRPLSSAWL